MYNCKWFRAMCAKPVEWGTFHIQVKLRKENSHRRCSHCPISWTTKLFWSLRSIIMWLCIVHACSVLSGKVSPSRILELDSRNELLSYILEKTHIYIYIYIHSNCGFLGPWSEILAYFILTQVQKTIWHFRRDTESLKCLASLASLRSSARKNKQKDAKRGDKAISTACSTLSNTWRNYMVEGSLEVKLPTICTDEKAEVGRIRGGKRRKKIREEKESEERRCRCAKR